MRIVNVNEKTQGDAERHARHHPFKVRGSELAAAKEWLTELLSHGPVYGPDCEQIAFAAGIPFDLLERAKFSLGVRFQDLNRESNWRCWGLWSWVLPDYARPKHHNDNDEDEDDEDAPRRRRRSARRDDDRGDDDAGRVDHDYDADDQEEDY